MEPTRIRTVKVAGHTSIQRAEVALGPLNVLVGANGSGKSNFIRALELLGRIADGELQLYVEVMGGASALLRRPSRRPEIRLEVRGQQFDYAASLQATSDDRLIFRDERILDANGAPRVSIEQHGYRETQIVNDEVGQRARVDDLVQLLRGCRVYHFSDTGYAAPVKGPAPTADNIALHSDAGNLAPVLWALRENSSGAYTRIVESVRLVAPFFRDFVLTPESADRIRLRWRQVDSDTVFSAHQMSDGTLRFVCLATLLLHPTLPHLIVLDEPELGLHPFAIVQVSEMLRAAGITSQIVIATQSVTMMDQFSLDDLIVVERERGGSIFVRPEPERLHEWLDEYSLGEIWQKNLIGGRPKREAR